VSDVRAFDSSSNTGGQGATRHTVTPYNRRMARRIVRRAHLNEQGVAVAFTFNNLLTTLLIGPVEDIAQLIPSVGALIEFAISILTFYFHRIVLVTEKNVYVYRDWPFHFPGKLLASYPCHPGVVRLGGDPQSAWSRFIRRGQLTFEDGFVVYHSIVWIRRARYIEQEANTSPGL
jgi:hypothetical protein